MRTRLGQRMRICLRTVLFVSLLTTTACNYGQEFALHDGDRVAFYGDSITAQRLYTRFVEDFVLTRYPQLHVTFWNAGIPGDTVYGGYTGDTTTRLNRDLFPHQPTVVTIMLGMNDGYYMTFNPKYLQVYEDGYGKLLRAIQSGAPSARVTLISPTPYDEVTHGTEFARYNEVVHRHADFVKEFAGSSHLVLSNFNQAETNLLQTGVQRNPSLATLLIPDRIHPAEASHWVLASTLVRSWSMSPTVSRVRLDSAKSKVVEAENTQITELSFNDGKLLWIQMDRSLPLPLSLDDSMIQFVLSISDLAAMDQQMLRVDGLAAARYKLKIDGHEIASFARMQLAGGVNLALYATPMENQARGVDTAELKRTRLDEARFLLAIEDPKADGYVDAIKAIEAKDAALVAEQRKAAQPLPHRFEISPE